MENDPMMGEDTDEGFAGDAGMPGIAGPPAPAQPPQDQWWIPKPPKDNSIDYDARNRQQAVSDLLSRVPLEQATKAIEMATRLEGMLGFDADRKAGVPVMEALMRWSPKLYFNHPSAIASLNRQSPHGQPFVPTSTQVDGQKLIQMSPNRYAFPPNAPNEFQPRVVDVEGKKLLQTGPRTFRETGQQDAKNQSAYKKAQYNNIVGQIKDLQESAKRAVNFPKAKQEAIQSQIAELRRKAESLYAPAEGGVPVPPISTSPIKRYVYRDGRLVPKE